MPTPSGLLEELDPDLAGEIEEQDIFELPRPRECGVVGVVIGLGVADVDTLSVVGAVLLEVDEAVDDEVVVVVEADLETSTSR